MKKHWDGARNDEKASQQAMWDYRFSDMFTETMTHVTLYLSQTPSPYIRANSEKIKE